MKANSLTLCVPCIILQCVNVTLYVPCIILQCVNVTLCVPCIILQCVNVTLYVPCIMLECVNVTLYVPYIILRCVDDQRDAQLLYITFYSTVFSNSTCFERNSLLHHQDTVLRSLVQYSKQRSWWWRSNSFETCRARKNGGIKIIYENCASRRSSTYCFIVYR